MCHLSERGHSSPDVVEVCDWPLQAFVRGVHENKHVLHLSRGSSVQGGAERSLPLRALDSQREFELVCVQLQPAHHKRQRQLQNLLLQALQQGIMGKSGELHQQHMNKEVELQLKGTWPHRVA